MNTTTKKKMPRARLMYGNPDDIAGEYHAAFCKSSDPSDDRMWTQPVAVIPCRTPAQARALVKFFRMGEAERVEAVAKAICDKSRHWPGVWQRNAADVTRDLYRADARAVLNLITGRK